MPSEDQAFTDYWVLVNTTLEVLGEDKAWEEEVRSHYLDGTTAREAAIDIGEKRRSEVHGF